METEDVWGDSGGHGFLGDGAGRCQEEEGGEKKDGEDVEWGKVGRVIFHRALGAPFLNVWVAIAALGRESCGRRGLLVRLGRTRSIGDPSDGKPGPKTCLQASLTQVFGPGFPPS